MKQFKVPTRDEVSELNQSIFDNLHKMLGFVPNLYAVMAYSSNGLSRYFAYQNAKTSLNNKEKEVVNLVVSEVNNCVYCLSAHTAIAKMNGFSEEEILLIRGGSATNTKLNALAALAKEITEKKGRISQETLDNFFAHNYNEGSLIDVMLQISDKTAMNYIHNLTEVPVDFPMAVALKMAV